MVSRCTSSSLRLLCERVVKTANAINSFNVEEAVHSKKYFAQFPGYSQHEHLFRRPSYV